MNVEFMVRVFNDLIKIRKVYLEGGLVLVILIKEFEVRMLSQDRILRNS